MFLNRLYFLEQCYKGKCSFIRNMKTDGNLNLYKGRQSARNSKNEGKHKDFFPYAYSLLSG